MGTLFHFDQMLPAEDADATEGGGDRRQVEIFRPSGEDYIVLRIGNLNDQHMGSGYAVRLDKAEAVEFLEGTERALGYFGWLPEGK